MTEKKEKPKLGPIEYACLAGGLVCAAALVFPGTKYGKALYNYIHKKEKPKIVQESALETKIKDSEKYKTADKQPKTAENRQY